MRHIVLDTNCLLRMIPQPVPPHMGSLSQWQIHLCVSNEIINEYTEILTEKVSSTFADNIVRAILHNPNVRLYDPQYHFHLITQDPDDNKFVDCAIIANADYIVSEDTHFNILKTIPFPSVKVLTLDLFLLDTLQ